MVKKLEQFDIKSKNKLKKNSTSKDDTCQVISGFGTTSEHRISSKLNDFSRNAFFLYSVTLLESP